jgi:hypothetical protein
MILLVRILNLDSNAMESLDKAAFGRLPVVSGVSTRKQTFIFDCLSVVTFIKESLYNCRFKLTVVVRGGLPVVQCLANISVLQVVVVYHCLECTVG